ncbi:MAG: glucokinase, partial [Burkholderiales bacterium]|nr:glucokinase [Burkholderiales bacterium]
MTRSTSVTVLLQPSTAARLVADVGGTHARFAWQAGPGLPLTDVAVLRCDAYPILQAALRAYLQGLGRGVPQHVAIAIANPVTGDQVT